MSKLMKPKVALISLFSIDLGIMYISSFLNSKGYLTNIISLAPLKLSYGIHFNNYITARSTDHEACPNENAKLLINLLLSLKPDLIGISVPSPSFITASFLTKKIKEKLNIPIIWGGIHPTICPEECISIADIVCVGEGEYPMYELIQKLENKEEITGIKNLWIKKRDGSIEKNELRNLNFDLDSLPYPDLAVFGNAFLIDSDKIIPHSVVTGAYRNNTYPIISSRGCPYVCSYCCNNALSVIYNGKGPYVRRRSPENVIDELVYARKNMVLFQIKFFDDIFTFDQKWIERFCQLYIKKVSLPFICSAHPRYTNKKIIEMLGEAGLILVYLGIQSGSESFCRDRLKRIQSNEEIIEFANRLKKLHIDVQYDILLDNPYESDVDLDTTAEVLLRLPRPYKAVLYSLCYYPKTELTNQALKDKFITEKEVEGKNNKAINNLFMFIDLVKDKRYLFWDLIVAMAVSNLFSEKLIRRCKRSKFFKRYPKILLTLIRLYLRFSLISPTLIFNFFFNKQEYFNQLSKLFKKAPRFFLILIKLYQRMGVFWEDRSETFMKFNLITNYFERIIFENYNYIFEDETKVQVFVFPKDSINRVEKSFHLKIIQKFEGTQYALPIKLRVCICPLYTYPIRNFSPMQGQFAYWEMNFNINNNEVEIEIEIEIDLLLSRLFFVYKDIHTEARPIKLVRDITKDEHCVVYFLLYDRIQKIYILKNCSIIYQNDILSSHKDNRFLYCNTSHLSL